jgi:protein TonB
VESVSGGYLIRNALTMETEQIPSSDLLDILFDGRNKAYGAYELRRHYNRRLGTAIAAMGAICLLLAGSYELAGKPGKIAAFDPITDDTITAVILPPKEPPVILPKPMRAAQPVATMQNTVPLIIRNEAVKPDDPPPPTQDQLDREVAIGSSTHEGQAGDNTSPSSTGNGRSENVVSAQPEEKGSDDFGPVEIESTYKGGMAAWQRFLQKNFHVPEAAMTADQPVTVTVMVRFIVDTAGNVSDAEALSGPDPLRQEAVRVIRKSGQWVPAIQNGRKVKSYKRQLITVVLQVE